MKFKICLLLGLLIAINTNAYADSIVKKRFPKRSSAIQSTNVNLENTNIRKSYNAYQPAITEIKNKLSANSSNYLLNINLADLYLKAGEYKNAFSELIYLQKLNKQNKLDTAELNALATLYNNQKNNIRTTRYKSSLYSNLSVLALLNNDNIMAETYINEALNTGSTSNIIVDAISLVYSDNTNPQKGIDACDKIINKNPNSTIARKTKAKLLLDTNNVDKAINEYITLVGLESENKENKYNLYKLLESKNLEKDDIIAKLYSAYPIKKDAAYYDIATILLENNEIEDAKYFANALAKNRANTVQGNMLLAEIYRKQGNLKESYQALNEVKNNVNNKKEIENYNVQLAKLSNNPIDEAKKLNKQGLHDQALKLLEEQDENNLSVIIETASAYFHSGDKQSALAELNRALSLYPDQAEVYSCFAYIYATEKDYETAKKYLDAAKKINPNSPQVKSDYNALLKLEAEGYIKEIESFLDLENYGEAARLVDKALKISPDVAALHFYKGYTKIAENDYAGSTAHLYKCIEIDPQYYLAYFYLAVALETLGEKENALANYQKFIDLIPEDNFEHKNRIEHSKEKLIELKGN